MTIRCPECDCDRAVMVRDLFSWTLNQAGFPERVAAGACVLCHRCGCRYEITKDGAKRLREEEKSPERNGHVRRQSASSVLADLAQPPDED